MPKRIRVKPSKPASLLGMIVGLIFVLIGFVMVIPAAGLFGVFWTLVAIAMTVFQAYNFFGDDGVASWEIEDEGYFEERDRPPAAGHDFEIKLRKLHRLKEDGLITEEEFLKKREEILREKW